MRRSSRTALITGGAGFIGCNLAAQLLSEPDVRVRIFDNLSRSRVAHNVAWLRSLPGAARLEIVKGDVRDSKALAEVIRGVTEIYHLAAQVAVTTSITDPVEDFEINALGTLRVLEAARHSGEIKSLIFTSTNKVYGALKRLAVEPHESEYRTKDRRFCGVSEEEPLDFHSPYGCSKGAADQYVRDYARIYNLPAVVFRMSCIAGPRQFGNEDQGWVAHLLYSVMAEKPVTIYGDGFQVRDVLHVHDLVDAMGAVVRNIDQCRGEVYNLGGGPERSISVINMLRQIEKRTGKQPQITYRPVRPGDQPLYISDTSKLRLSTGWAPKRSLANTLDAIQDFWKRNSPRLGTAPLEPQVTNAVLAEEVA